MTDIRIAGTANLEQMRAQFRAIQQEVKQLNAQLATTMLMPGQRVNPAGYRAMQAQTRAASQEFRDAAASSGQFLTQQLRLNTATEQYTELLKKQKLSFSDIKRNRSVLRDAYVDQVRLQNMVVRENKSLTTASGKTFYDVAIPKNLHESLNTTRNELGWLSQELKSGSRQLVNWGKNTQWAGRQLMVGFTMPVAAFGAATGILAYSVDKQMTRIKKVYDTTAQAVVGDAESMKRVNLELAELTEQSMKTARVAAEEYGAAASDTLGIQAELAATGIKGQQLQTATIESMRLASLGELDYQQAASTTIALQTAFKLSTEELTEAFNFMNATENATSLSIQDIAEATPRAASAMSALGVSVEQMTVLLTSMKESGVDAAEAANALKSATGTILAPSPAAQNFIDQITGGTLQVSKLAEEADGNLYVALQKLSEGMTELSQFEKQQILVKLFGKYQFNRVSAMLYNLEDAFNGTANQTSKAMELMGEDTTTLANLADTEMKRYQESVSGRFKNTLESLKIDLAEMGMPFLEVATMAMGMAQSFAQWFNSLPEGIKNFAAVGAIVTAIIGPAIMLAGLFGNLIGNIGLGAAAILGLITKFNILNKAEWATQKSTELVNSGFIKQGKATDILAAQVNSLTASLNEARAAATSLSTAPGPRPLIPMPAGGVNPIIKGHQDAVKNIPDGRTYGPLTLDDTYRQAGANPNATRRADVARLQSVKDTVDLRARETTLAANLVRLDRETAERTETTNRARERGAALINKASVGTAAMSASMLLMMQPWSEAGKGAGQFLLLATIAVPAMQSMALLAGGIKERLVGAALAAKQTYVTQTAAMHQTTKLAGATAVMSTGVRSAGAAFAAMMGPIGWITTAIAAIGFGMYKWNKSQQEILDNQIEAEKAINNAAKSWAESMGEVVNEYEKLNKLDIPGGENAKNSYDTARTYYRENDDGKEVIKGLEGYDGDPLNRKLQSLFVDFQTESGMTAAESATQLTAIMVSLGYSLNEANMEAQGFREELGNVASIDWASNLANQGQMLQDTIDKSWNGLDWGDKFEIQEQSFEGISDAFTIGLNEAASPEEAKAVFDQLQGIVASGYDGIYETWMTSTSKVGENMRNFFKEEGIADGTDFSQWWRAQEDAQGRVSEIIGDTGARALAKNMEWNNKYEKGVVGTIAANNDLSSSITTLWELWSDPSVNSEFLNWDEQVANAMRLNEELIIAQGAVDDADASNLPEWMKVAADNAGEAAENTALTTINAYNAANGFKQGATPAEALKFLMGKVKVDTGIAADEAERLKKQLNGVPNYIAVSVDFTGDQYKEILQRGMEGVTNDMADLASSRFDSAMDNAISGAEAKQDSAMNRLENAQEKALRGFEDRWERRKEAVEKSFDARMKAIDNRIEGVDKVIEAEQKADEIREKIFQKEMERISRLNDAANRNIDFNVALNSGDFDEAAKIRNDAQADADRNALEDAMNAGSGKSERRIDRLENKKDTLEDQKDTLEEARDQALKALDKREEDERRHLDKMQEMRKDALQKQTDAEVQAMEDRWQEDKDTLDERLTLFKSYTARNQKDLERWMKVVGLSYDDFGIDVKDKGDAWSKYFRNSLADNVRQAGTEIMSDNMWEGMGKKIAKDLLGGALDMSWGQFKRWMTTGEFNTGGYNPSSGKKSSKPTKRAPNNNGYGAQETMHSGGEVGTGVNNRTGVARTTKGLHSSEVMVRAQKGEYMWDRKTTENNRDIIEGIHNGSLRRNNSRSNTGSGVGGGPGIAGVLGAIAGAVMKAGIARGMEDQIQKKKAQQMALPGLYDGMFGAGQAGMYSDRSFSETQLRNAATIASVGSGMGMSARDIMIGIMTAITESGLVNVNYGDRDSLGLFQQRPSMGWGTPEQVTNPEYAARKFFEGLKGIGNRGDMAPWLAAQAVQRSFDPTGANYQQYWDNAQAIFKNGLTKSKSNDGYMVTAPGKGGWAKPSVPGKGWSNTHDYRNGIGSPLYAYNDGTVVDSRAITSGGSPGNGLYPTPYRSYGETIAIRGNDGNVVRYAHLSPGKRFVKAGTRVSGGQLIGLSGNTGNSTGPHTHFDVNGSYNASGFFASHGIGLKTGGYTATDGMANLHKQEVVIDPMRTKNLFASLDDFKFVMGAMVNNLPSTKMNVPNSDNVANSSHNEYNAVVNLYGADIDIDDVTQAVSTAFKKIEDRKPGNRNG